MSRCTQVLTAAALFGVLGLTQARAISEQNADLNTVKRAVDTRYHLHGHKVPMMWMVSGIARWMTWGGVRGMQVVTYENFRDASDKKELAGLVRSKLNEEWSLIVREHSKADQGKSGEDNLVWVQPHRNRVRMLVVSLEESELDLVQMELSPEAFSRWKDEHDSGSKKRPD